MAGPKTILAIDRNPRNLELLHAFLAKHGYHVEVAATLESVDLTLSGCCISLALVDIAGFDRGIWERCERMRVAGLPFVVIFPQQQAALQEESFGHGAHGTLTKPLMQKQLLGIISGLLGGEAE
ncbi:MAG: PleD family two-component system response regulator [Armatimonadota bacterium]